MSKIINHLFVDVQFSAYLNNVEVSDEVYNGLKKMSDEGWEVSEEDAYKNRELAAAFDWLIEHTNVNDEASSGVLFETTFN